MRYTTFIVTIAYQGWQSLAQSSTSTTSAPGDSTTTTSAPGPFCDAGDFELIAAMDSGALRNGTDWSNEYNQINAVLQTLDGFSARSIQETCYDAIWEASPDVNGCADAQNSAEKSEMCLALGYLKNFASQASPLAVGGTLNGDCDGIDLLTLSTTGFSHIAGCVADDGNSFSACLDFHPIELSQACNDKLGSLLDEVFEHCINFFCNVNYHVTACSICSKYAPIQAASYSAIYSTPDSTSSTTAEDDTSSTTEEFNGSSSSIGLVVAISVIFISSLF
jgi:hypothetical protein